MMLKSGSPCLYTVVDVGSKLSIIKERLFGP